MAKRFFTFKKVKYEILDDKTIQVAKNEKYIGPLVIPETIEKNDTTYKVVSIESGAFNGSGITSVDIPGSIKRIHSFGETSLESVTLHEGIEIIGAYAFENCNISSIYIPESVNIIEGGSFQGCELLEEVIFAAPFGLTEVSFSAFEGTKWLSNVLRQSDCLIIGSTLVGVSTKKDKYIVPKEIDSISPHAFEHCPFLKEVYLPEGITELSHGVFNRCSLLEKVSLPSSLRTIGVQKDSFWLDGTFNGCQSLKEIELPCGLEEIGHKSFSGCSSLKRIILPKTVKKIGKYAFDGCSSLTELMIPDGINELPENVFYGCTSLRSIHLPNTLLTIGNRSFGGCYRLSSINIPESVREIGKEAFWECYDLADIDLPNGLEVIRDGAFGLCNSLTSICIPKTVKSLGNNTFWACYGLREAITSDGNVINDSSVFSNCPYLGKKTPKADPSSASIEILSDPFECECFINLTEKDIAPYMKENYVDPNDRFASNLVSFVKWGRYREGCVNEKDISLNSLFFRPMEYYDRLWTDHYDMLQETLSHLKIGSYGIIDRREMYKSREKFQIDLKGFPFNKYCLKLLRMSGENGYSPISEIQKRIIPNMSMAAETIMYCGKKIEGEFQSDMGSQGRVKRIVFYKEMDGTAKIIGEYTY